MLPVNNTTNQLAYYESMSASTSDSVAKNLITLFNEKKPELTFGEVVAIKSKLNEIVKAKENPFLNIKQIFSISFISLAQLKQQVAQMEHHLVHRFAYRSINLATLDQYALEKIFFNSPKPLQLFTLKKVCKRFNKLVETFFNGFKPNQIQRYSYFNKVVQKVLGSCKRKQSFALQWEKIFSLCIKELKILPDYRVSDYQPTITSDLSFTQLKELMQWHEAIQLIAVFSCIEEYEMYIKQQSLRLDQKSPLPEIKIANSLREIIKNKTKIYKELNFFNLNLTRIPAEIACFSEATHLNFLSNSIMYWTDEINPNQFKNLEHLYFSYASFHAFEQEIRKFQEGDQPTNIKVSLLGSLYNV